MKKLQKILTVVSFSVVLAVFASVGFYSFFDKDEKSSAMENRNLAQKPAISISSYFSGDFASKFEEYYNDQFPGRNGLVKISNKIKAFYSFLKIGDGATILQNKGGVGDGEALSHEAESNTATSEQTTAAPSQTEANTETTQPENAFKVNEGDKETVYTNNYIVLLDNRLMEQYTNVYKKMDVYAETLNKLKSQMPDVKVYSLMAPTSIEFYAPKKYNSGKSHSQYQGINYIYGELKGITPVDTYPEIAAHTNEYLYFRSDHHWTARGAYYAYRAFAKTAGFTPVDINTLETGKLSPFLGTLYRATQSSAVEKHPDYVEYFIPKTHTEAIASDTDPTLGSNYKVKVINTEIKSSNKYLAFLGGDHGVTKITTDAPGDRSIVVIKESYANAFVPWLCNNYKTIYVIDPRQLNVNLASFVKTNAIDEVLFLNYMFIPTNPKYMAALEKMG